MISNPQSVIIDKKPEIVPESKKFEIPEKFTHIAKITTICLAISLIVSAIIIYFLNRYSQSAVTSSIKEFETNWASLPIVDIYSVNSYVCATGDTPLID